MWWLPVLGVFSAKNLEASEVVDNVGILRKRRSAVGRFVAESGVRSKNTFPPLSYTLMERGRKVRLHTEDCGLVEGLRSNHQIDLISQPFLFLGQSEIWQKNTKSMAFCLAHL